MMKIGIVLAFFGLVLSSLWGLTPPAVAVVSGAAVTTEPAIGVSGSDAIVRGSVNLGGQLTRVWFEWGKGSKLNQTTLVQVIEGTYSAVIFQALIFDLDFDTSYSYRAVARNADGTWYGETKRFTTEDNKAAFRKSHKPNVHTESATGISYDRVSIRGRIELEGPGDPRRDPETEGWFEWGESADSLSKRTSRQRIGGDGYVIKFSDTLVDLNPNTTHYYRAVAKNSADTTYGEITSFTTKESSANQEPFQPSVSLLPVKQVTTKTAILEGKVNPNGRQTDVWFEWGTTLNNLINRTGVVSAGNGNSFINISSSLTGLSSNTTYYYRVEARNDVGTSFSSIENFRTNVVFTPPAPTPPEVTTRVVRVAQGEAAAPAEQAIKFTLEADKSEISKSKIVYFVNYGNLTDGTLRDGVVEVHLPDKLEFVDSDRQVDEARDNTLVFKLGAIRGGDRGRIEIKTERGAGLEGGDQVAVAGSLSYLSGNDVKYIVSATDITEITKADSAGGGLTATILNALKDFLTNPVFWLLIGLLLFYLIYRFLTARRQPLIYSPAGEPPAKVYPPQPPTPPTPMRPSEQAGSSGAPMYPVPPRPPAPTVPARPTSEPLLPPRPPEPPPFG